MKSILSHYLHSRKPLLEQLEDETTRNHRLKKLLAKRNIEIAELERENHGLKVSIQELQAAVKELQK